MHMFFEGKKKELLTQGTQSRAENCSEPDIEGIRCRWPFGAPPPPMLQVSMRSHLAVQASGSGGWRRGTPVSACLTYTRTHP